MLKLGVSYYGNRIPWRVKEDLKEICDAGCNYVVFTFSEEDMEFYQGAFAEMIGSAHAMGLEVWLDPWGVGQAFGGETYSSLIAKNLSLRQISSTGESLPIACPSHPAFRNYLLKWIQVAKQLKADVLFWDEPHFMIYPAPAGDTIPKLWACRCPICQERYQRSQGTPMPDRLTPEVKAFKEESLVDVIQFLYDATKAQGFISCVCLLPVENSSTVNDWAKVAAIPSLDILATDPYWRPHQTDLEAYVGRFSQRIKDLCERFKKEGQIWILNFNIPKGEEGKIQLALEAAYKQGIRNFAAWSYYGAAYISIRAEDPAAVWKALSDGYRDLRRRG